MSLSPKQTEAPAGSCCGHDHHEHHHDHGCCGHDSHEHHHPHDHSCCGHDHHDHDHHSHGQERTVSWRGGTLQLSSREHEGAAVCSVRCQWANPAPDREEDILSGIMKDVARWVVEQGGFIGHIKASLECSERRNFSITQEDHLTATPGGVASRIELAAIVFGIRPAELEERIVRAFEQEE